MSKEGKGDKGYSRYDELSFFNIIAPIQGALDSGAFFIREKDLLIERRAAIGHQSPWLFAKHDYDRECALWAQVMFKFYHFVPRGCQNCWKVVCRPRTLEEAFGMLELQKKMGIPSKTGMEQREYTGNLGGWGSFWYCPHGGGLEMARKTHVRISKAVKEKFGEDLEVILKRGCTEMEHAAGPSDKWIYSLEDEIKEEMITAAFVPPRMEEHPKMLQVHIEWQWIRWAAKFKDMTYLKYTGGKKILPDPVTYHESEHKDEDFGKVERRANPNDGNSNRDEGSDSRGSAQGSPDGSGSGEPESGIVLV